MKKNIFIMLLISSLISLSGYGQQQSFKFKSSGTKLKFSYQMTYTGDMKINPEVIGNGGATNTLETSQEYTIKANTEYTVTATDFKVLVVYENLLTSLDVSKLTNLRDLWCGDNNLTSIDVSKLKKLEYLNCRNNKLTDLDVKGLSNLKKISCHGNKFDVCALDALFENLPKRVDVDNAEIFIANKNGGLFPYNACKTDIATGKKWKVYDYNNNISNVLIVSDQTGCQSSFTFQSSVNKFKLGKSTEHSGNITIRPGIGDAAESTIVKDKEYTIKAKTTYTVSGNFTVLTIWDNNLTNLDVSKLHNLKELNCSSNQLSSLDVSGLTKLKQVYCHKNIFDHCAIDDLFRSLPNDDSKKACIFIAYEKYPKPTDTGCRISIANGKGWEVKTYTTSGTTKELHDQGAPYGCPEQSFTFKSEGTKFKIGNSTEHTGNITIKPGIAGAAESTIVKGTSYTIKEKTTYTVSGNFTALKIWDNNLTNLDVSKLHNLKELTCANNNLTSLDVSGLIKLKAVYCQKNEFDHCAIDVLFRSLPNDDSKKAFIFIAYEKYPRPTDTGCRIDIANKKGWTVKTYTTSGSYKVLQDQGAPFGCPEDNSIPENLASELDIKVFPNPVRDALQIESEEIIKQVSVFDISGKLLIKELVNDVNFSIPTADLNTGMYVLRIQTDKDIRNVKIIKE